jgi:hypothetical protein
MRAKTRLRQNRSIHPSSSMREGGEGTLFAALTKTSEQWRLRTQSGKAAAVCRLPER